MSYMWNEFNIKTFPAETIVYRDGVYCPELSTLLNEPINDTYDLPIHIIYVGEIAGDNNLDISVGTKNQKVVLSVNVKIKKPAFLNIFIKNAGKNSEIRGTVLMDNYSELTYICTAHHLYENTGIFVKNKLIGRKNSKSKLSGTAIIDKNCSDCDSDVGFTAMVERDAKIDFMPAQRISSIPISAEHSASIYKPTDAQILYLRQAGLGTIEIDNVIKEAFLQD